ncbi:arsenate reductase ArsC [Candidatus Fermentibacteria bacterium]|nr:MAG: arsenate reductase ArsC [Candidatus Fermentibacteria bacterium]
MSDRIKILFLCTGNSCRSQMAEGFCKHLSYTGIECFSAGIAKHGLNPIAVKVMSEIGIDISNHLSKTVDELDEKRFDYVVTVCGHANENCPYFPAETEIIHRGFDDPPRLAENAATENEVLAHYRRVRDEIRDFILEFPEILTS